MVKLSVNINKIATIRNARGGRVPDVVEAALRIEGFGADGITVHPRPDERHITRADVRALCQVLHTEFNIEGYPSPEFTELVLAAHPAQVTLVPDAPGVLTSSQGWNVEANAELLTGVVKTFRDAGIRVSIFVDADPRAVRAAARVGAHRVELYTGPFAEQYPAHPQAAIAPYRLAAQAAQEAGLGLNAGHDLSLDNLAFFSREIKNLDEVSIGHALISDALYMGLENTVAAYKRCLEF